jgi:hypothetical protein
VTVRKPYRLGREGSIGMADHVADRVDRDTRTYYCAACGDMRRVPGRAPLGWLRVSALIKGTNGHADDWDLLGMTCSTACLIVLAQRVDRQAKEVADG